MPVLVAGITAFSGGALSQRALDPANAFALPMAGLTSEELAKFNYGRGLFHHVWAPVEHADGSWSGLGPLFNADSCAACHIHDGRGDPDQTLVLGLSGPEGADPEYGAQLQDHGIGGLTAEGRVAVTYEDRPIELPGGETVVLQRPVYSIGDPGLGAPDDTLVLMPRLAPPLIGLGLLAAVPQDVLERHADPEDRDGDGISGRLNMVPNPVTGTQVPGRFGWTAGVPYLESQIEFAAHKDMGLSSFAIDRPEGDCTPAQSDCLILTSADRLTDLSETDVVLLADYLRFLAVPARRNAEHPDVLRGEELFAEIGCAACHLPTLETGSGALRPLASLTFAPYTDLLLHDMGNGLAEDGEAGHFEWRTAPLWGIGLTEIVSGHQRFLHDGRADGLAEAIYWHGGEAEAARNAFAAMQDADKDALLAFLGSL